MPHVARSAVGCRAKTCAGLARATCRDEQAGPRALVRRRKYAVPTKAAAMRAAKELLLAETPVELPDDLVQRARTYGISIAEVAERALREAVAAAEARQSAAPDVQDAAKIAAERLAGPEDFLGRLRQRFRMMSPAEQARCAGIRWARDNASAEEMQYVANYARRTSDFRPPDSLLNSLAPRDIETVDRCDWHPGRPEWRHFQAGVREVWEAIGPLR